jgi:hypothetical protein
MGPAQRTRNKSFDRQVRYSISDSLGLLLAFWAQRAVGRLEHWGNIINTLPMTDKVDDFFSI